MLVKALGLKISQEDVDKVVNAVTSIALKLENIEKQNTLILEKFSEIQKGQKWQTKLSSL